MFYANTLLVMTSLLLILFVAFVVQMLLEFLTFREEAFPMVPKLLLSMTCGRMVALR